MTFYWRKSTVWPENRFKEKNTLKTAFSRRKISASPHFGRTWMTNYWLQVNFRGTPESSVVWRFKLAMWKVGGIKIESAAGRQNFLPKWNGTSKTLILHISFLYLKLLAACVQLRRPGSIIQPPSLDTTGLDSTFESGRNTLDTRDTIMNTSVDTLDMAISAVGKLSLGRGRQNQAGQDRSLRKPTMGRPGPTLWIESILSTIISWIWAICQLLSPCSLFSHINIQPQGGQWLDIIDHWSIIDHFA